MQCLPLVYIFLVTFVAIIAELFQAKFMFDGQQHYFEIIRYFFSYSLLYDEIIWHSIFHVCMMITQCFQILMIIQCFQMLLMMISQMVYYYMCFLMDTYLILHVYGVRVFLSLCMAFLMWLRKGVVVTCQSGSTRCTTSCHYLFSLVYIVYVHAWILCRFQVPNINFLEFLG